MENSLFEQSHHCSIQNVMSAYCRFVDTKNWRELQALFVENPRMTFRDADGKLLFDFDNTVPFVRSADEAIGKAVTLHQLHNPEINLLNDTEAKGVWAMEDRFYLSHNATQPFFHGAGYYHVRFTFFADRWRISELLLLRLWLSA